MSGTSRSSSSLYSAHFDYQEVVEANPVTLFAHLDDHTRLSSHMEKPSWKTLGAYMRIHTDDGLARQVGSKITLEGAVFGMRLYVQEVVTTRTPPLEKQWRTIGTPRLLVIGHYQMGFSIASHPRGSSLRVFIDYAPCEAGVSHWLSRWFAPSYARWCTRQMAKDAQHYFAKRTQ